MLHPLFTSCKGLQAPASYPATLTLAGMASSSPPLTMLVPVVDVVKLCIKASACASAITAMTTNQPPISRGCRLAFEV